jgi:putative hydrolase of the HAD superfamily
MIKTIIFDLDGMIHHSDGYFSINVAKQYGIGEEVISVFFKNEFKQCLIGKADLKEELKPYLEKWNFPGTVDEFMIGWFKFGEFDKEILEYVKELQDRGFKCILLTNNEKYRMQAYENELSVFDKVLASCDVGFRKPSIEMFDKAFKEANCKKEEILFCDDKQKFVDIAKEYGFQTHLYENLEKFKKSINIQEF